MGEGGQPSDPALPANDDAMKMLSGHLEKNLHQTKETDTLKQMSS